MVTLITRTRVASGLTSQLKSYFIDHHLASSYRNNYMYPTVEIVILRHKTTTTSANDRNGLAWWAGCIVVVRYQRRRLCPGKVQSRDWSA